MKNQGDGKGIIGEERGKKLLFNFVDFTCLPDRHDKHSNQVGQHGIFAGFQRNRDGNAVKSYARLIRQKALFFIFLREDVPYCKAQSFFPY